MKITTRVVIGWCVFWACMIVGAQLALALGHWEVYDWLMHWWLALMVISCAIAFAFLLEDRS